MSDNILDPRIVKFLKKHHVLTLTTVEDSQPWSSHAFYALNGQNDFVFTSDADTIHIRQGVANPRVSVSVVLESKIVGRLQGAQITGLLHEGDEADKTAFLKKFPYAVANLQKVWRIEILTAKYTDNTLGFGTKLKYSKINAD